MSSDDKMQKILWGNNKAFDESKNPNAKRNKKLFVIFGIFIIISVLSLGLMNDNQHDSNKLDSNNNVNVTNTKDNPIDKLNNSYISNLKPNGLLKDMFMLGSKYTDLQRKNKLKEIKGAVVQWKLKVYEIREDNDFNLFDNDKPVKRYRVQTRSDSNVGCIITVFIQSDRDRKYLESLKTDDYITIKGALTGDTTVRNIEIEPAIIVY